MHCPAALVAVACVLIAAPGGLRAEVAPRTPDDVPGLVAWYNLDPVHRRSREGEPVDLWRDSSTHGHHLQGSWENQAPQFHPNRLNGKPEVTLRRANRFDVHEPFELGDYTIFLVYDSALTKRAFVGSETDPQQGIVLRDNGRFHYYQNRKLDDVRYNRVESVTKGFTVTVLAREAGRLRAFIDGADVSTGLPSGEPLRVGRLFYIEHTTRVKSDGEGLRIAEMVFYDRYLTDEERHGVTVHLAGKFGLEAQLVAPPPAEAETPRPLPVDAAAVRVRASSRSEQDLNQPSVLLVWDVPGRVDRPFHFDPDSKNTSIVSAEDGTRARVTVTLPLRSRTPGARIRLLILVDDKTYLEQEGLSQPFVGPTEEKVSVVELQTGLTLNAGQSFRVVASADNPDAPGAVRVPPGEALLIVERIE